MQHLIFYNFDFGCQHQGSNFITIEVNGSKQNVQHLILCCKSKTIMYSNGRCNIGNDSVGNNNAFKWHMHFWKQQCLFKYDTYMMCIISWVAIGFLGIRSICKLFQIEPKILTNQKEFQVGYKNMIPWVKLLGKSTLWTDPPSTSLRLLSHNAFEWS
jgi:hypothetical protein